MITPYLEKLIHEGIAVYRTWVHGGSAVGTIPVRKKSFIVITDFHFSHFSDIPEGEFFTDLLEGLRRSVHQLEFASSRSRNHYVIRGDIQQGETPALVYSKGGVHFDTYLVHDTDVQIMISTFPYTGDWATTIAPVPAESGEFNPPALGMVGLSAVEEIDLPGFEQIIPLTAEKNVITPNSNYRPQFRCNYYAQTMLNNPNNFNNNRTYPIINIGYVEINKEIGKIAQGTI